MFMALVTQRSRCFAFSTRAHVFVDRLAPSAPHAPPPAVTTPSLPSQARRGHNVDIRLPLFEDKQTPEFRGEEAVLPPPPGAARVGCPASPTHGHAGARTRLESVSETEVVEGAEAHATEGGREPDRPHVHMDAMAFGMGCCCLQVTFQVSGEGYCLPFLLLPCCKIERCASAESLRPLGGVVGLRAAGGRTPVQVFLPGFCGFCWKLFYAIRYALLVARTGTGARCGRVALHVRPTRRAESRYAGADGGNAGV